MEELEDLDEDAYARLIAEYETSQQIQAVLTEDQMRRSRQS